MRVKARVRERGLLESARARRLLTQVDLAQLAGLSTAVISRAERRDGTETISLRSAQKIADALGVLVKDIFDTFTEDQEAL